jgi:hypothetical protein
VGWWEVGMTRVVRGVVVGTKIRESEARACFLPNAEEGNSTPPYPGRVGVGGGGAWRRSRTRSPARPGFPRLASVFPATLAREGGPKLELHPSIHLTRDSGELRFFDLSHVVFVG